MILAYTACLAIALTSAFVWPVSRPISVALAAAALSSAAYALLAVLYPDAHAAGILERQRLVSAAVGLVGAWELGRVGPDAMRLRLKLWRIRSGRLYGGIGPLSSVSALALLCLASMASDGAAWLFFRARWPWVGDASTLIFCGLAVAVCRPWRSK